MIKNIPDWTRPAPTTKPSSQWLNPKHQFELVDGRVVEYKKVMVHEFFVNSEDVVVEAARYLYDWEKSEAGQWVMNHAVEQPVWHKYGSPALFGAKICVVAVLKDKDFTFWQLKWGNNLTQT
jgi:hypothetical protein